jgi:GNAT superfamily N-acetyltransferase
MSFRLELATGRVLRPSVPNDAPRLVAMFERCSPASRYARFLAPLRHFPASHLVDVVRSSPIRRSWVIDDLETGQVVGVGSWFRNQHDTAELGLLVEDRWQHQGLGRALLHALAELPASPPWWRTRWPTRATSTACSTTWARPRSSAPASRAPCTSR